MSTPTLGTSQIEQLLVSDAQEINVMVLERFQSQLLLLLEAMICTPFNDNQLHL
jgi:hypothetical protein